MFGRVQKTDEGLHICPNCNDEYEPDCTEEEAEPRTIEKEQHQTGICSDECWNEFVPSPDE